MLDSYRRDVQRHQEEIARLQRQKAQEAKHAADLRQKSSDASIAASRASSVSSVQSKLRDVQRYEEEAVRVGARLADYERKIGEAQRRQHEAQKRLANEEQREADRRQRSEQTERRLQENQLRTLRSRISEHELLHRQASSAIARLQQVPEDITVLFMASNPLDQDALRLDEEARAITETIRKSKHRDSIRFQTCWAVRPFDILQALNEHTPRIVHFSGHGSSADELVLQADNGDTKLISKEAIVQAMATSSDTIRLVFFNTCFSRNQAEAVVQYVDAAIGMKVSIGDDAARVFASQFYSAVGFGQSALAAFNQAKAALMLEGLPEQDTPELFLRQGVDGASLIIVRPPEACSPSGVGEPANLAPNDTSTRLPPKGL